MHRRTARHSLQLILPLLAAAPGCAELTAIGHVSDRETSSTVSNVDISASTDGKKWKSLGKTDGSGAYWILKAWIPDDAKIKLAHRGYYPLELSDHDFLGSRSHLLTPTGNVSDPFDPAYERSRHADAPPRDGDESVPDDAAEEAPRDPSNETPGWGR